MSIVAITNVFKEEIYISLDMIECIIIQDGQQRTSHHIEIITTCTIILKK